jgi:hypothetical protein
MGGSGIVARGDDLQPQLEIERPPQGAEAKGSARRLRLDVWRGDPVENELQRRARRQALALMLASSVISLLLLYGVWTLFSGS